jgi:hypothetical protein
MRLGSQPSHEATFAEMAALRADHNWARSMNAPEGARMAWLVAAGVRKA